MARRLTEKQSLWVSHYLQTWNATEAAKRAGYRGDRNTLATIGSENLNKPKLRAEIEERLEEAAMSASEVLARLTQQARADISELIDPINKHTFLVDLEALQGRGHLIKELRYTREGPVVKLYNSQRALELLGKHYRLFAERVEHTDAEGEPLLPVDKLVAALREAEKAESNDEG